MGTDCDLTDSNVVYFVGNGCVPENTAVGQTYRNIAVGLIVDIRSAKILDANVTLISPIAKDFIRAQLVGHLLTKEEVEVICKSLNRYQAPAQKAIIVAFRGAYERYLSYIQT